MQTDLSCQVHNGYSRAGCVGCDFSDIDDNFSHSDGEEESDDIYPYFGEAILPCSTVEDLSHSIIGDGDKYEQESVDG